MLFFPFSHEVLSFSAINSTTAGFSRNLLLRIEKDLSFINSKYLLPGGVHVLFFSAALYEAT